MLRILCVRYYHNIQVVQVLLVGVNFSWNPCCVGVEGFGVIVRLLAPPSLRSSPYFRSDLPNFQTLVIFIDGFSIL